MILVPQGTQQRIKQMSGKTGDALVWLERSSNYLTVTESQNRKTAGQKIGEQNGDPADPEQTDPVDP